MHNSSVRSGEDRDGNPRLFVPLDWGRDVRGWRPYALFALMFGALPAGVGFVAGFLVGRWAG